MKDYKQIVTIDGDELEAVWCHEPQTMDEPEHWTLVTVDGFPEHMCPEQIWVQAEAAFDWTLMQDVEPDMDFEEMLVERARIRDGW